MEQTGPTFQAHLSNFFDDISAFNIILFFVTAYNPERTGASDRELR
jgi:hypothetical protein